MSRNQRTMNPTAQTRAQIGDEMSNFDTSDIQVSGDIILVKSSADGWYCIEHAEHAHKSGMRSIPGHGMMFWHSGQISDANVEGSAEELAAILDAIESRGDAVFRRCSVYTEGSQVRFRGPPNSTRDAVVTLEVADRFVTQARALLAQYAGLPSVEDALANAFTERGTRTLEFTIMDALAKGSMRVDVGSALLEHIRASRVGWL